MMSLSFKIKRFKKNAQVSPKYTQTLLPTVTGLCFYVCRLND